MIDSTKERIPISSKINSKISDIQIGPTIECSYNHTIGRISSGSIEKTISSLNSSLTISLLSLSN